MDGRMSEDMEPEQLYVVNTDEDDEGIEEEDVGSYDEGDGHEADGDGVGPPSGTRQRHLVDQDEEESSGGWETVSETEDEEMDISNSPLRVAERPRCIALAQPASSRAAPSRAEEYDVTALAAAESASAAESDRMSAIGMGAAHSASGIGLDDGGMTMALTPSTPEIETSQAARYGARNWKMADAVPDELSHCRGGEGVDTAPEDEQGQMNEHSAVVPLPPCTAAQAAAVAAAATTDATGNLANGAANVVSQCASSIEDEMGEMPRFYFIDDDQQPKWHHYWRHESNGDAATPASVTPQFARMAQKQWKLLEAGLPCGIFVAAFASRVDLLRALIIGPPGTPYQDAVFVFDLQLPPEFPQQPPAVFYISHGERINPNLYENGKVCLSLLGTWSGRESCELWNPQTSSVLQVLISIQGLVLCEMPYFNEAGYEKQLGSSDGAHHARRYNEGAMLLTLKSMLATMRQLSPPFEELSRLHFRAIHRKVLQRCRKLLELKAAGSATACASAETEAAVFASSLDVEPQAKSDMVPTKAGATSEVACRNGKAAVERGPVAEAGLSGVLNTTPSLGFLHSLERMLPSLEKAFDSFLTGPADP